MLLIPALSNQKQVDLCSRSAKKQTKQNKAKNSQRPPSLPTATTTTTNKQIELEVACLQSQLWKGKGSLASQRSLLGNFQAREIPYLIK